MTRGEAIEKAGAARAAVSATHVEVWESEGGGCDLLPLPGGVSFSGQLTDRSDERFSETAFLTTMRQGEWEPVALSFESSSFGPRSQHEADAGLEFEPHLTLRAGKLEAHRVAVEKMRAARWPYRRVAGWLREERGIDVNPESVRRFCRRRGIGKGGNARRAKCSTS